MVNKYRNKPTEYNGRKYHSKKEADFARSLDMQMKAANKSERVSSWEAQVKYPLKDDGELLGVNYIMDFVVHYHEQPTRFIEIKGYKKGAPYQLSKLKQKICEINNGIKIEEL